MRPVKSNIPLQCAGVYKLHCDCGLAHIGQTRRGIGVRVKEHIFDVKNIPILVWKPVVYEHTAEINPTITSGLISPTFSKENIYIPGMFRQVIEVKHILISI